LEPMTTGRIKLECILLGIVVGVLITLKIVDRDDASPK
jgi:hypothetical protein